MPDIVSPRADGPFPEIREALTHWQTWVALFGYFIVLVVGMHWPGLWEFSLLCFFPAGLFIYGAFRSGAINKPPMMKIVITLAIIHFALLAVTLLVWRKFPKVFNGDYGFSFVVVETAVIGLLMRFDRKKRVQEGSS